MHKLKRRINFILILSCAWLISDGNPTLCAQPSNDDQKLISAEYQPLEFYIGAWTVSENHFNVHGKVIATVKGTEENRWILDRHAVQRTYTTSTDSNVYRAVGTFTWIAITKKYQGVWFDNASIAGPNIVEGDWIADTNTFVYTMTTNSIASNVKYKIVEKFLDEKTRLATTYEVRGSKVIKKLEVRYTRTTPCPAKIRYILDIDQG